MKRYVVAAIAALILLAIPATASAHSSQKCSGWQSGLTPSDIGFQLENYRGYGAMQCSSVRYAAKHLRKRMENTRSASPNVSFTDGYVRWHCYGSDGGE